MSPLNSYFLQGSPGEQRLVQDLINEQLKMYGQDVLYMPRKIIGENTVIKEITASKFDDSFRIEAYLMNFEGFSGNGELLTQFGIRNNDEVNLVISKERYNEFILPKMNLIPQSERKSISRPAEGDLIYFPLDESLFEIKYVEGKKPFYQLQELYVYELRCERFEFEDEVIDIQNQGELGEEINESVKDFGNIYTLNMVGTATTIAEATVGLRTSDYTSKSVQYIDLVNDGHGYKFAPNVAISTAGPNGVTATAVAIMTSRNQNNTDLSIDRILITEPGYGYTTPPKVTISGGQGEGGIATAVIRTGVLGLVSISTGGVGYTTVPQVIFSGVARTDNAVAEATVNINGQISDVRYSNAGAGYTSGSVVGAGQTILPTITFTDPSNPQSFGDYKYGMLVTGSQTGTEAYVKDWNAYTRVLKLSSVGGNFALGEAITGAGVSYRLASIQDNDFADEFADNIDIESEADKVLDFSERNPFGEY